MTRWFLTELHRRYQLDGVEFLVDDADYLGPVFAEDGGCHRTIVMGGMRERLSI
ncbi:transposase [Halorubrum sp. AJ67]|nr:transposase [Halorubrum sp. AJ67]